MITEMHPSLTGVFFSRLRSTSLERFMTLGTGVRV